VEDRNKGEGVIRGEQEEDRGQKVHDEHTASGGVNLRRDSLVDLNRAGTPLLEIVSQPDLSSPEEAKAYLEEIRLLMRELEVSDCEMQEGSLRCDANINIHVRQANDSFAATPIVEIKNLNSFRGVERALRYEAQRQYEQFQRDGKRLGEVPKATAGWDDARGVTVIQRRKEEASDYRYFPDPDLVPVVVDDAWLERTRGSLGELPAAQRARLQKDYGLSAYDAGVLTREGRALVGYFEETAQRCGDAKAASNWITNQVLATLKERKQDIRSFPISAANLAELIKEVRDTGMNNQRAREVYAEMLASGVSTRSAIDKLGFKVVADASQLGTIVRRAIAANPKAVADFKKGKTKAADAIKGAVMRETKGMAKADVVQQLVMAELQKV